MIVDCSQYNVNLVENAGLQSGIIDVVSSIMVYATCFYQWRCLMKSTGIMYHVY
jgi:hypothetical protein